MSRKYLDNLHYGIPQIHGQNVPIIEIAKATGKDPQFIMLGLQRGIFKYSFAFKNKNSSEYSYFCPNKQI